jgi:uncharacterized membrane protein
MTHGGPMVAVVAVSEDRMSTYEPYLGALLIGVVAGLRALTAPAAMSWAASIGAVKVEGSPLGFLYLGIAPWILTAMAIGELVVDQLPSTPSRKTPRQFAARIASGAVCGAAAATPLATPWASWAGGLAGSIGAILGTVAGSSFRAKLARAFRRDRPAALIEDAVALVGAVLVVGLVAHQGTATPRADAAEDPRIGGMP